MMSSTLSTQALVTLDLTCRHMYALRDGHEELRALLFTMIESMYEIYPHVKTELNEMYPQKEPE